MQTPIFQHYTGSAFLNNALQTIQALAELDTITEITPNLIKDLYQKYKIWELFPRMKSYSMLFTRNGPLLNDKDYGVKIYRGLMEYVLDHFETEGENICEISGLRYHTSFEEVYARVLYEIGYPVKKIANKDKTINRCWFPLIGALGSDAQALPQAKFGINIHPICLIIIQFLPFSALIYKGGILLVDSINFEFTKDFIEGNTARVIEEINLTSHGKSIENIKDFTKGTYLLKAIQLFAEKKNDYGDIYSDLNLWSFSNSGTGASCEIDRVSNQLFQKLLQLYHNLEARKDLIDLISDRKLSNFFLEKLEAGMDYWRLYPAKKYEGVGIAFFDQYQELIGNHRLLNYAKYIASLLAQNTNLKKAETKLLEKTDAYSYREYATLIYTILVRASENQKWNVKHHLQILDKPDTLPIESGTYYIYKLIHYYYQKSREFYSTLPQLSDANLKSQTATALSLIVSLIQKYEEEQGINVRSWLLNPQEYKSYSLRSVLIHAADKLDLEEAYELLFDNFKQKGYGLNDLLRIYFSNPVELPLVNELSEIHQTVNLNKYRTFSAFYLDYYFAKYQHKDTGVLPLEKFQKHVLRHFPKNSNHLIRWLEEFVSNCIQLLREQIESPFTNFKEKEIRKQLDDILYDDRGIINPSFTRFAIEFSLHKTFSLISKTSIK